LPYDEDNIGQLRKRGTGYVVKLVVRALLQGKSTMAKTSKKKSLPVYDIDESLGGVKKGKPHQFSKFNQGTVGLLVAAKGTSPWELHEDSDKFLQVLDGAADIEVLTDDGSVVSSVEAGQFFIVPRGNWHRHIVGKGLQALFVAPGQSVKSDADDPRAKKTSKGKSVASASQGKAKQDNWVEKIRTFANTFPSVTEDMPWGHPAFKVKNKMFVTVSFQEHGIHMTVKLSHSRLKASTLPFVEPCGYGLGEHGWVTADLQEDSKVSFEMIKEWITESFRNVAPKTILKEFDRLN
jgi:predicted DNA-binding protein (MmcQ/YjbR family)/mannose-6-phosphate isomerase-like protein (cupin superfamily)